MTSPATSQAGTRRDNKFAMLALLAGGLAIGASPIFVRLSELGPLTTAVWRLGLALIPFAIWLAWSHGEQPGNYRKPSGLRDYLGLGLPGVMLAADLGAWHLALNETTVANATLFSNMAPIFVTLGSWLIFRSAITRTFLAGLAIAIVGVIVLKGGPQIEVGNSLLGDALAIVAAIFYAGYILGVGRLRMSFDTLTIMIWSTAVACITLLPLAILIEPALFPSTLYGLAILFGIAWISHAGGQGMITFAMAWLSPAFSSLTLLIQPVVAAILAWIILSEPVGLLQAIGGVIILAGIMVARRG
jgi:drug/metabolite transporter (DMT)-like permease